MFDMFSKKGSNICIADIPNYCEMELIVSGNKVQGKMIHNYGASLVIKTNENQVILIDRDDISRITINGKEYVDSYITNITKKSAELTHMLNKVSDAMSKK